MTTGWRLADKQSWPAKFGYDDPVFAKTMCWVRVLTDRGFAPARARRRWRRPARSRSYPE
ncbi:hypothetical protein ACGFMK_17505 [Amycolatopsis sp. NPDC049252]|uniref:hypothetical protein n=1 Tax=Amycolatopsis sp. NPDC049252 TaxID=3363933 RepID=UPI003718B201